MQRSYPYLLVIEALYLNFLIPHINWRHVFFYVLLLQFCILRGYGIFINEMKVALLNTGTCTLNFKKKFKWHYLCEKGGWFKLKCRTSACISRDACSLKLFCIDFTIVIVLFQSLHFCQENVLSGVMCICHIINLISMSYNVLICNV